MKPSINTIAFTIFSIAVFSILGGVIKATAAEDTLERVIWDKKPIPVLLKVDEERLIHFPADIRYWLPEGTDTVLQALSANGVLYLEALQPFETVRIRIQDVETQSLYLLDVTGTEEGTYPKELVVLQTEKVTNLAKNAKRVPTQDDWFIRLTRFAAQSLYAPERLLPADTEIQRISVDTENPISLVRGGDIEAIPVGAWRGGGLYLTAVRLRNQSQHAMVIANRHPNKHLNAHSNSSRRPKDRTIDLRTDLRGDWLTAAVQHTGLKAAGSDEDRTCLYLISKQPIEASL